MNFFTVIFFTALNLLSINSSTSTDDLLAYVQAFINSSNSYVLPENNDEFFTPEYDPANSTDSGTYDFIIIGAGTAGGVLANRLTEENFDVLVIEAGKEDPLLSSILGLNGYLFKSDWNWAYQTVPQKNACLASIEQSCFFPRGKSLGGSSAINGAQYIRGNALDYDEWEAAGNTGWSYQDCLPYFKKSERAQFNIDIDRDYHGFQGPQNISVVHDTENLTSEVLKAFKELGAEQRDYNGRCQQGSLSRMQYYLDYNVRASTAHAFIRPVQNRTNLYIILESLVTKIRIEDLQANGVEFVRNGKTYSANARKEVIVSAGTINSPQVLMLSGIGPKEELTKHGIEVLADLPVGQNLYDHVIFNLVIYRTNYVYYNVTLSEQLDLWKKANRPLVASLGAQVLSFWNLDGNETNSPDVSLYVFMAPKAKLENSRFEDIEPFEVLNDLTDISVPIGLLHPKSAGSVTLQSSDPRDFPLIDPNYFGDTSDLDTIYEAVQIALQLNNTSTFRQWQASLLLPEFPSCDPQYERLSKDWWYCVIRNYAGSMYHPIGTTRMGVNPEDSVVDPDLKVHGIKNLRVVDAGVIPIHTSGHLNAPVVMIAEKIADAIKAEHLN